jgi:hypothetical protein
VQHSALEEASPETGPGPDTPSPARGTRLFSV